MITHDLGIVAQYCRRATVMYAGQAVEVASTTRLFDNPLHPYTQALLGAIRSAKSAAHRKPLPGLPPDPTALPKGCFLHPRCPVRRSECAHVQPTLRQVERGHWVRCILYPELDHSVTSEATAERARADTNDAYATAAVARPRKSVSASTQG